MARIQRQDGAPESSSGGPIALRMLLGAHLRRLREAQGVSREEAGWEIRASESKISRMELGRVSFKERDVDDLLTLYEVDDDQERDRLLSLAREANHPGWWHRFGDVLPSWFQSYLGMEAAAALIRNYEVQFIPGLLQTPEHHDAHQMPDMQARPRAVEADIGGHRFLRGIGIQRLRIGDLMDEAAGVKLAQEVGLVGAHEGARSDRL